MHAKMSSMRPHRLALVASLLVLVLGAALAPRPASAAPAPSAREANARGMKRYRAKDYAAAAREFQAAIALDASFVLAHYNLASMAALLGDKPTVLAQLRWLRDSRDPEARKALAKAPTDPDLRSMVNDPEVRELIGPAAAAGAGGDGCEASCEAAVAKCDDGCGDGRGCLRLCDAHGEDCRAGCALGMDAEARARMRAWLDGPLTGNDNDMARMRVATISRRDSDDGGAAYQAFIKNQFGFTCTLTFAADGSPALLSECQASEPGWRASPPEIKLRCRRDAKKKRDTCSGGYRLQSDALDDAATFTLERAWK
jgi:hypothetical protein